MRHARYFFFSHYALKLHTQDTYQHLRSYSSFFIHFPYSTTDPPFLNTLSISACALSLFLSMPRMLCYILRGLHLSFLSFSLLGLSRQKGLDGCEEIMSFTIRTAYVSILRNRKWLTQA